MAPANTHHIDAKAEFHPLVLLPGDPGRAMAIATAQLEEPRMFNHRRGLWGYSGRTPEGVGMLVQATGMGGPSAAIVCEELVQLGAEVFVRVGTCGAIDPALKLGDVVVVQSVLCDDGASQALGAAGDALGDPELTEALSAAARGAGSDRGVHLGKIASADLFYDPRGEERHASLTEAGVQALEMEAATVFTVAARHRLRAACVLGVTDELYGESRRRLGDEGIVELGDLLGAIAVKAVR